MDLPWGYTCYSVDTSAYVDLRRNYNRRTFRSLWNDIERLISEARFFAPHEVFAELQQYGDKQDDLLVWAKTRKTMFIDLDTEQREEGSRILADFQDLIDPNKTTPEADPFVVALALSKGSAVVTQEKMSRSGARPRIPNVCQKFGVKCLSLEQFFLEQGWEY